VKLNFHRLELKLAHEWTISSRVASGGKHFFSVVFVHLEDSQGRTGHGEAAPSIRYEESAETVLAYLKRVDPDRLSFDDVAASLKYLNAMAARNCAAKAALDIALLDGAARHAGKPIYDLLDLGFTEGKHTTSFSIGIDRPEIIRQKVIQAEHYPILKLKVGSPQDRQNLSALREVAPDKWVRVDANEAWKTKEEALRNIEWLAEDKRIQFVEQPMPASTEHSELVWLHQRSPLPLFADESYHTPDDAPRGAEALHGVNVKLVKSGGISGAYEALRAARKAGLQTMLGCMIESSLLITAAAHLAELTDFLDLDGNLLITNDPYLGVIVENGVLSFSKTPELSGLRASRATEAHEP
jgi:L-alanine-DL-glutamate epimerase-like enolase superfamily enzyme